MKYCQKEIRIAMIEADMTLAELAERAGYASHYLSRLLNKEHINPLTKKHILKILEEAKNE